MTPLTVEALAQELNRLDTLFPDIEWAPEALATILLPFIERHIAAGQQGADADLLLTVAVELEAQARAEERKTPSDGDGPSALREWARKLRSLATPQPPKPAGAVPATDEELHTSVCLLREWLARLAQGKELRPDAGMHSFASEEETFRKAGIANARVNASAYLPTVEKVLAVLAAREAAGRADAVGVQIAGRVHEDELPENYPYDAMFPHSKVDGVRLFPVFAPLPKQPAAEGAAPNKCEHESAVWALIEIAQRCGATKDEDDNSMWWTLNIEGFYKLEEVLRDRVNDARYRESAPQPMTTQGDGSSKPISWQRQALLLMDEVDRLVRHCAVCAETFEFYKPCADAFWKVCRMIAESETDISDPMVKATAAKCGVYYGKGKVDLGAPLYAFTPTELIAFARNLTGADHG